MTKEIEKHNELLALYHNTTSEILHNKTLPWKINIANAILTGFLIIIISNIKYYYCINCLAPFTSAIVISSFTFTFFTCFIAGNCFDKAQSCKLTLSKIYQKFSADFNESICNKNPKDLDFGDITALISSILFPIFLLITLVTFCVS